MCVCDSEITPNQEHQRRLVIRFFDLQTCGGMPSNEWNISSSWRNSEGKEDNFGSNKLKAHTMSIASSFMFPQNIPWCVFPAVTEGTHPKHPIHEGRKIGPNRSIIRKHRAPEEIRKERKVLRKQKGRAITLAGQCDDEPRIPYIYIYVY